MKKSHVARALLWLFFALFAVSCSSDGSVDPDPTPAPVQDEASADETGNASDTSPTSTIEATPAPPAPTLADDELADVVELDAGEQIEDVQGNLVAIYGYQRWPAAFASLSDAAQEAFPFVDDLGLLGDPEAVVIALDVAMCSAGIDATGFGTAEFFVHSAATEPLLVGADQGRGIFVSHPVVSPGFSFPTAADCARGWVPVLWADDADAAVARYLVSSRSSVGADVERHLYQWNLDAVDTVDAVDAVNGADAAPDSFAAGQTVTFNDGAQVGTTVQVQGWAELVGRDGVVEGTRPVAVRLTSCPSEGVWPEFGLGLDGWNLAKPENTIEQLVAGDDGCFDGWLEFAVPFGAVPTAFFASDGVDPNYGYAEWSLQGAAIAPPSG